VVSAKLKVGELRSFRIGNLSLDVFLSIAMYEGRSKSS